MKEGMTLREFIEELTDMARNYELGMDMEVVALADNDEPYTPVIGMGPGKDGVVRCTVA